MRASARARSLPQANPQLLHARVPTSGCQLTRGGNLLAQQPAGEQKLRLEGVRLWASADRVGCGWRAGEDRPDDRVRDHALVPPAGAHSGAPPPPRALTDTHAQAHTYIRARACPRTRTPRRVPVRIRHTC